MNDADRNLTKRQKAEKVAALNEAHAQIDRLGNRGKWEPAEGGHQGQRETLGSIEARIKRLGG